MPWTLWLSLWAVLSAAPSSPIPFVPVPITEPIVFDKHVYPIFAEKCASCHDREGGLAEGDFDLLTVQAILKGGKRGPAIVAGKGAESLLVRLSARAEKPAMPPKGESPLTSLELSIIKAWVDQGAKPGTNPAPGAKKKEVVLGDLPPGIHPVYALDIDRSGSMLACGRGNQVHVHDLTSGALVANLTGHKDIVQSVRFSPDGRWLAAGGYGTVQIWPRPLAQAGRTLTLAAPAVALVLDPSGSIVIAGAADGTIRVADAASLTLLRESRLPGVALTCLAVSPDGALLAVGSADNKVRILRWIDMVELAALEGHSAGITDVAFSADGHWLASGSRDHTARLWPIRTLLETPKAARLPRPATQTRVLSGHAKGVTAVAFTGSGLCSASEDGTVRCWDIWEAKSAQEWKSAGAVAALASSPNGELLAAGCEDGSLQVWRPRDASTIWAAAGGKPIRSLQFSRDSSRLASGAADGQVRVWDAATGTSVATIDSPPAATLGIEFFSSQQILVAASALTQWQWTEGWTAPRALADLSERVTALAFSPDSRLLATGAGVPASNGEVALWDVATLKKVRPIADAHTDLVLGLSFSPDGKWLASASADKFLKVFDVATGKMARSCEGHTGQVLAVAWKPDGKKIATGGADGAVKLWSFETGEQIASIGRPGRQVTGVAWVGSSDVLAASCGDKRARLIQTVEGKLIRSLAGATDFLYAVGVSPDGKTVVAGGQEGTAFVWNAADGKLLRKLAIPSNSLQAAR